ncbi:hypothetical protein GCM10028807_29870 [Spirosoma daeguense]
MDVVSPLSDVAFYEQSGEKWSVADVTQHLYLSAKPVVRLMTGPRDVLLQWGSPEVPSRTYQQMEAMYRNVLATGVKAPATMSPRPDDTQIGKAALLERFTGIYQALVDAASGWTEQELDTYCLPHPALGKLSMREMLLFTCLHTQHHLQQLNY